MPIHSDYRPVASSNDIVPQAKRYSIGELRAEHLGAVTAGVDRGNLTDAGLGNNSFHQGADVWTNGSATSFQNAFHSDHNHGKRSNWDVICDVGTFIKQDRIDLQSDALMQQVNDFAGLINPDSMRPAEYFSHNPEWFAPGSAVDVLGASNPMGIEPNQMMGSISPISRGDMFAAANELRSDNRF